jgi:chromosome partitioning protein
VRAPTPGPRRTVFWHQKGGTGKTTLAIAYAVRLVMDGQRALLIDTDPQGTATAWGERFAASWGLVVRGACGAAAWRSLADRMPGFDHLVLDCPPAITTATMDTLIGADDLVIPVRPAMPDLWALDDVALILADLRAGVAAPRTRVVFNQHRGEDLRPLIATVVGLGLQVLPAPIAAADTWSALFSGHEPPVAIAAMFDTAL